MQLKSGAVGSVIRSVVYSTVTLFFWLVGTTVASATSIIDFDPSKNVVGGGSQKLTSGSGTIKALTYLTGASNPVDVSIRLINTFLSFLGLFSMIMLLYAGFIWFKAKENEEEIKKAKDIIRGGLTGLVIALLALGLAKLLFDQLSTATVVTT